MKRFYLSIIACLSLFSAGATHTQHDILSPDGKTVVSVDLDGGSIHYRVRYDSKELISRSRIGIEIVSKGRAVIGWELKNLKERSVNKTIIPPVKEKRAYIPDIYNEAVFEFSNQISLEFRAYDDGVAYRFRSRIAGDIIVTDEIATFVLPSDAGMHYSSVIERSYADKYHTPFEEHYTYDKIDTLSEQLLIITPVLVCEAGSPKVLITESDVEGYPGMFLHKRGNSSLVGEFPPYPLKEELVGDEFKQKAVVERADFIAKTKGNRTFPWRVAMIAPTDAELLVNDLVYRLGSAPKFSDFSWIKPGKGTEEWITGLNLYQVDFRAGINTRTYKYYIDFASQFGFEYVMLDAGWSNVDDLFDITPGMDIEELARYADEKGVGLIFWTLALTMERQMDEALTMFKKLGVKVVMTDFIDRNDQLSVNFMHKFANSCADAKLMCMIHGAPPPYGFSRTHPHMLTREGVLGSEYNLWSTKANPDHDLILPFIRMSAGPMDYEPGAMQHSTQGHTEKMGFEKVIAQGTRMHQIAMFVVYESPLQLFSGNLSDAYREPELMTFTGKIPTVWDETFIIHAELGKVIVEARRHGDVWYVAGMNNWEPAEIEVALDFLGKGKYTAEEAADGINADRNPHDYKMKSFDVSADDKINIKLAPGGGYVIRFERK